MANLPGAIRPPMDPTMSRYTHFYPVGVVPRLSLVDAYYSSDGPGAHSVETRTRFLRSRSLSNATLDARDIRANMEHSLTDLFQYQIDDVYEPLDFDNCFPYITHLVEAFRVREHQIPMSRLKAGWHRIFKPRVISRPKPYKVISEEYGLTNCADTSLRLMSLYMPISTHIYLTIFTEIFGLGNAYTDLKHVAAEAVHEAAKAPAFRDEYADLAQNPLTLYLTNDAFDNWQYDLGSVGSHGLSCLYYFEGINFALQTGGQILNNCRQGARVILYRDPLLHQIPHETVYPPESFAPGIHASQARRLLVEICRLTSVAPEGIQSSNIRPSLAFFLGDAVRNMSSGIIYSETPEMFSLGLKYALRNLENGQRSSPDGVRGRRWFSLNILALAGCFLVVELARISGIEHEGGQDIRPAPSLYWFTTFEASIFTVCVQVLKAIYDSPTSIEGQALHGVLQHFDMQWKFDWYYRQHEQATSDVKHNASEFYPVM